MVIRAWLFAGVLIIGVAWYLTVLAPPPTTQATAQTAIDGYRAAGLMPAAGDLKESTEIGHEVFELPPTDAERLEEELASQTVGMAGMNMDSPQGAGEAAMPGMNMDSPQGAGEAAMPGMNMDSPQDAGEAEMPGMTMADATPDGEKGGDAAAMQGMAMDQPAEKKVTEMQDGTAAGTKMPTQMADDGDKPEVVQTMPGMNMEEAKTLAPPTDGPMPGMKMDQPDDKQLALNMPGMTIGDADGDAEHGEEEEEEAEGGGGGIQLVSANSNTPIDRTIEVKMTEWGYNPGQITVKPGEVVRFVVTNAGDIPHEFMIMTRPGMASVGYRIQRADWSLTEHEAIFEKPLVMPGDTFETVLKIDQPGAWMFMCMFPFHMQLGMMGMMMTEGVAGMNM